jgi:hypothetical protein
MLAHAAHAADRRAIPWPTAVLSLALSTTALSRSTWELLRSARMTLSYSAARALHDSTVAALEPHLVHHAVCHYFDAADNADLYERHTTEADATRGVLHNTIVTVAFEAPEALFAAANSDVARTGSVYRSCDATKLLATLTRASHAPAAAADAHAESALAADLCKRLFGPASSRDVVAHALALSTDVRTQAAASSSPNFDIHRFGYRSAPALTAPAAARLSIREVMTDAKVSTREGIALYKQRIDAANRKRWPARAFNVYVGDAQFSLNLLRHLDTHVDLSAVVGIGWWHALARIKRGAQRAVAWSTCTDTDTVLRAVVSCLTLFCMPINSSMSADKAIFESHPDLLFGFAEAMGRRRVREGCKDFVATDDLLELFALCVARYIARYMNEVVDIREWVQEHAGTRPKLCAVLSAYLYGVVPYFALRALLRGGSVGVLGDDDGATFTAYVVYFMRYLYARHAWNYSHLFLRFALQLECLQPSVRRCVLAIGSSSASGRADSCQPVDERVEHVRMGVLTRRVTAVHSITAPTECTTPKTLRAHSGCRCG